ncbi:thymidine kinase [Simkania negevensis]|uniref:Thymidine kinase n=1 Tax=Simkania negevensis TaxID=83561 RepID=A0ABS3ARQ8_9BACT|nr:thymidine kinase [Simkania negevensis]
MAKLYFRYGTMGSAKTMNLLAVAHNYRSQGKEVLLLKPALDNRFGKETIRSRAGLEKSADMLVDEKTILTPEMFEKIYCVLVDEAQFISPKVIEQLRTITLEQHVPVICYGLRTNFRGHLFEGSKRLMELADSVEEIKTTCAFCNKKAIMNLKHVNGVATVDGPVIDLGKEEKYNPACYRCYQQQLLAATKEQERSTCSNSC